MLYQITDIFKGGKPRGNRKGGRVYLFRLRLEYQQIKEQGQELDYFFHHRGNLRCSVKYGRFINSDKKGVHIGRNQAGTHARKGKEKKAKIFPAHTESGNQKRSGDTHEDVFNIGHVCTHDKRMNDCLPPILFSAIFKLLKVLPDTELDAC